MGRVQQIFFLVLLAFSFSTTVYSIKSYEAKWIFQIEQDLEKYLAEQCGNKDAADYLAYQQHLTIAEKYRREGNLDAALSEYTAILLRFQPTFCNILPQSNYYISRCYQEKGEYEKAVTLYFLLVLQFPNNPFAVLAKLNLGLIYADVPDYEDKDRAKENLLFVEERIESHPILYSSITPVTLYTLGFQYTGRFTRSKAKLYFRKVIIETPDKPGNFYRLSARRDLGLAYMYDNEYLSARSEFWGLLIEIEGTGYEEDVNILLVRGELAVAYCGTAVALGGREDAVEAEIEILEELLTIDDPWVDENRNRIYVALGQCYTANCFIGVAQ